MSLTESTAALRKAQRLAAEYAKETDNMVETINTLSANIEDVNKRAHLISESLRELIGDPKTEDEIADPLPGGNGGIFKAKETLAKGHGISDRGTFAHSDLTAGQTDYAPDPEDNEGGTQ